MNIYGKITMGAVVVLLAGLPARGYAGEIQINNWPQDVPCDALRKNPDESWTQTKTIVLRGNITLSANTFKNTGETRIWDRKCRAI